MEECAVCGKIFIKRSSLIYHVSLSYAHECLKNSESKKKHCPILVYRCLYEGESALSKENLEKLYWIDGKSTPMIASELGIMKLTLLHTMRYYNIRLRNRSSATKNQINRLFFILFFYLLMDFFYIRFFHLLLP